MADGHPFSRLTPDFILSAIEGRGYVCDGRLLALNSYENRVYQVGLEEDEPLIAKFYRPGRWSREAIAEEHAFAHELLEAEWPVVAPLCDQGGHSVTEFDGFLVALYPRRGGRAPELDREEPLRVMGRCLARLHAIGGLRRFASRETLDPVVQARDAVNYLAEAWVPLDLRPAYLSTTADLLTLMDTRWSAQDSISLRRVHGDCHAGNVLWRDGAPLFVDLDDSLNAPAVQDLWMLLSGSPEEQRAQLAIVLEGYHEFADFDYRELALIEVLRSFRMIRYAAWLGRRWTDPAFPQAFPWFDSQAYWERHVLDLREQLAALSEPFAVALDDR